MDILRAVPPNCIWMHFVEKKEIKLSEYTFRLFSNITVKYIRIIYIVERFDKYTLKRASATSVRPLFADGDCLFMKNVSICGDTCSLVFDPYHGSQPAVWFRLVIISLGGIWSRNCGKEPNPSIGRLNDRFWSIFSLAFIAKFHKFMYKHLNR